MRQAISAALDRQQMSTSGEAGFEQPASPTGLMPGQEKYLDAEVQRASCPILRCDPTPQADRFSTGAGFKKGSDGIYADARATSSTSRSRCRVTTPTMCRTCRSRSRTSRRLASA